MTTAINTTGMPAFGSQDRSPYAALDRHPADVSSLAPTLLTVISTEEEFDWTGPFRRDATQVEAMRSIGEAQRLFERCGVRPTYVIDYPVASQRHGFESLREFARAQACEIGAHLHPWVSPPVEESAEPRFSYPGNLPAELEARKIERLTETIATNFGFAPRTYQAGRYGFGPSTAATLIRLGYRVDFSAAPPFDFGRDGGPDYVHTPTQPAWLGARRELLCIPITGAFIGSAGPAASALYRASNSTLGSWLKAPAVLSRSGLVERVRLSPEGFSLDEMKRLTRTLLARGERVFVFSMHSPSFKPGCTPYVKSAADLKAFLATCEAYYEYFFGELAGVSMTPTDLLGAVGDRKALDTQL